ncbi:probable cytochrome P450 6a23 [Planococcus citri]|uniref:probable cytochrome P450 6a23 n=1 Tax=Planococcus citri TaxID=170843 RepID=UPI0031F906FC
MDTCDLLICVILLLFLYLYFRFKDLYSYFDQNGVPFVKPVPFFGNAKDWILMRRPLPIIYYEVYTKLKSHRFGGMYIGTEKNILIRDPKLIKNILVKDFSYFQDRPSGSGGSDLLDKSLLRMRGDEWKNLRIKLTSTFTSGKMKLMFPLVRACAENLHQVLKDLSNKQEDFDVKDVCSRYTIDVIGSCVFGLEINSLHNPDSVFRKMGNKIFEISFVQILGALMPPPLQKIVKLFGNDREINEFFAELVQKTVKYREENNVSRGDFLDLLINLKNETDSQKSNDHQTREDLEKFISQIGNHTKSNVDMTVELMTAQCFLFFGAGFETSSSTLSFMLLELARNPHIQDKLRNEIRTVLENNNNELTYETIKQMKYLDMVIDETLRKYPTTGRIIRICGKPYEIPDSKYVIPEGTTVIVSLRGLHYDTEYYEKPDEFYPEHFSEQAKAKRPHYTFLPFGDGPRSCMGERFGKMQIKIGAVNLLRDFSYSLSSKVKLPVEHLPGIGLMNIKGGIWLKCHKL